MLFISFDEIQKDDVYMYADYENERYYIIEYSNGNSVASYVEIYNRNNLNAMRSSVKNASDEYHYLVSSFKKDNTILITSMKK
jgi:hypothetical protein